ncbi:MAG: DUF4160 domain-containing protein [Verrucomicrobia bacterium]|nr:DUF4160 domain-containing protein [Verrucomicrobiota bacterium]
MVGNENSLQGATARNKSAIHATRPQTTAGRTGTAARTCSLPYRDEHPPPHFHASYGEFSAQISIRQPAVLRGRLPPRVLGYVTEWAVLHEEELLRC